MAVNNSMIATRNRETEVKTRRGNHGNANVLVLQNEEAKDTYGIGNRWLNVFVFN